MIAVINSAGGHIEGRFTGTLGGIKHPLRAAYFPWITLLDGNSLPRRKGKIKGATRQRHGKTAPHGAGRAPLEHRSQFCWPCRRWPQSDRPHDHEINPFALFIEKPGHVIADKRAGYLPAKKFPRRQAGSLQ